MQRLWHGRFWGRINEYGTRLWDEGKTLKTRGYDVNRTVYLKLWYHLMWTRVPDLPKGTGNYRFGVVSQVNSASEQHVLIPAIAASRLLWLSTGGARSTLRRRLILACESKNASKNKKDCNQIAHEWLISRSWGLTKRRWWNYCKQNNLSKTQNIM